MWPICIPEESSDEIDEWWQKGLTLAAYGENTKNEVENDAVLTVETFIGEKSTLCSGLYDVSSFDAEMVRNCYGLNNLCSMPKSILVFLVPWQLVHCV